jgi:hypothetical protein
VILFAAMQKPATISARRLWSLLAALLGVFALTGCQERERSSGPFTTETREVGHFDSIQVRGGAQLHITIGAPASLTIEGSEEAVRRIDAEVDGNTLRIQTGRKEWLMDSARLTLRVTLPKLEELQLQGGNDVRVQGFAGGDTRIEIEGAANLKALGHVDGLVVQLSGAGRADLRNLIAKEATVTVDGVGSVHVHATESLDATMNGVGAILYSGTPREVNTAMRGLGTISRDRERKSNDEDDDTDIDSARERKRIDPAELEPEYEV